MNEKILKDPTVQLLKSVGFSDDYILKGIGFDLENYPVIQEKLGTPDYDECFGYSLLLALGGSEDIENIKIVKTIPYIDICTQTIGEFEIADKW